MRSAIWSASSTVPSITGRVDEIDLDKNKVKVTISMFGRETAVELEPDQVELLDD